METEEVFNIKGPNGLLKIKYIQLFSGVTIYFQKYDLNNFNTPLKISPNTLRLDYAFYSSVVINNNHKDNNFFDNGFLKISKKIHDHHNYSFPSGKYRGITILINTTKFDQSLSELINNRFYQNKLSQIYFDSKDDLLFKETYLDNLFEDLKRAKTNHSIPYLKLKIAELILYLTNEINFEQAIPQQYFSFKMIKKIKEIQQYLVSNLDKKINIESIAKRYNISSTNLKNNFKFIYHKPIHKYIIEQRMLYAKELLTNTQDKITNIALQVGYTNASKFADAFKKQTQITPNEYRKLFQ